MQIKTIHYKSEIRPFTIHYEQKTVFFFNTGDWG